MKARPDREIKRALWHCLRAGLGSKASHPLIIFRPPAMTGELSADPSMEKGGGEREPTHGAGGCIDSILNLDDKDVSLIYGILRAREFDEIAVLLHKAGEDELYAIVYYSDECPVLKEVRYRRCGSVGDLLKSFEWPEVSEVSLEGRCAEIVIPGDTSVRVRRALDRLGVKVLGFLAWMPWQEGV